MGDISHEGSMLEGSSQGRRTMPSPPLRTGWGDFPLVYNGEYTPSECLSIYRNGDSIEKVFRILKTDLDIFPMRVRKESTIRGMISSGLMHRYSLERMLLELEKLHVIGNDSGNMSKLERTRKQKDILEALEKVSWW